MQNSRLGISVSDFKLGIDSNLEIYVLDFGTWQRCVGHLETKGKFVGHLETKEKHVRHLEMKELIFYFF